jgi:hypothetical protein
MMVDNSTDFQKRLNVELVQALSGPELRKAQLSSGGNKKSPSVVAPDRPDTVTSFRELR